MTQPDGIDFAMPNLVAEVPSGPNRPNSAVLSAVCRTRFGELRNPNNANSLQSNARSAVSAFSAPPRRRDPYSPPYSIPHPTDAGEPPHVSLIYRTAETAENAELWYWAMVCMTVTFRNSVFLPSKLRKKLRKTSESKTGCFDLVRVLRRRKPRLRKALAVQTKWFCGFAHDSRTR